METISKTWPYKLEEKNRDRDLRSDKNQSTKQAELLITIKKNY
jgi:hypothetical protein